jgi:tetratricopeptide (TPR) repeat protein
MHELLRQFADEKLTARSAQAAAALRNHAAYYLDFVQQQTRRLLSSEQHQALLAIDQEIHNIRAAWQRAVALSATREIDNAIDSLFDYYGARSYFQEGCDCFALAAEKFSASIDSGNALLISRLCSRQAQLYYMMGRAADAEALLPLLSLGANCKHEEAFVLNLRGTIADVLHKDRAHSESWLQQSLEIFREIGDLAGQATLLRQLAILYEHFGSPTEALKLMADAVTVSRQFGQPTMIADMLIWFGIANNRLGAYIDAQNCWKEALALYQELGNDHGIGESFNWLGWSQWCAGDAHLAAAVGYYEQAIVKYQQSGAQVPYAMVLGDLAHALLVLGDYERAMQNAKEGLRICEATGDIHMIMYSLNIMGAVLCARSDFADARQYLTKSLALAQAHQLLKNCGLTLYLLANLLKAESQITYDVELQQEKQRQARQLYRSVLSDPATWQVYKDRAKAKLESIMDGEEAAETKPVEEWAVHILTSDTLSC